MVEGAALGGQQGLDALEAEFELGDGGEQRGFGVGVGVARARSPTPEAVAGAVAAVTDLRVTLRGSAATVTFSAPADEGGGTVARYQVKCSDRPIVGYQEFLRAYAANEDGRKRNWWMAANLKGEPPPKKPGTKETFTVTGVPAGAKYFAVRSFDGARNRSGMSNVAAAGLK